MCVSLSLIVLSCSPGAAVAEDLAPLKQFEGFYQLVSGDYHPCATRKHVEVTYDNSDKHLSLNRLDNNKRRRGWNWLDFPRLNQDSQLIENFFGLARHVKYVARKSNGGWKLRRLEKKCQMRFLCGRWQDSESVSLAGRTLEISLLQETHQCTYRRVNQG
jgi:hypothetical protein